jgi:hypothetical protein
VIKLNFTATALELFNLLESREPNLNDRGKRALRWLRARYPSREVIHRDDETWVTKIRLWPPEPLPTNPPKAGS